MWKVLPKFGVIKALAIFFSTMFVSSVIWFFGDIVDFKVSIDVNNFFDVILFSGSVSIVFVLVIMLLAKFLWRVIWCLPIIGKICNRHVCPDLNGVWEGWITSNYKDENGNNIVKDVRMTIKADFLGFNIKLISLDNYQHSTVVQSEIYKDPRDGNYYISYVYESVVDVPKPTDDSKFDGAARLAVRMEDGSFKLVGLYWKNRKRTNPITFLLLRIKLHIGFG